MNSIVPMRRVKQTLWALVLLAVSQVHADPLGDALNGLEADWAKIYYAVPESQQGPAYAQLLARAVKVCQQYPKAAGALFWQAVIKASYADHQDPISALSAVNEVRDLLNKVLAMDPNTMGGSAYVVLGTLYHLVPGWPIAFGDDDKAEQMFQTALKISPNGIDSNFYYAQFLLDKGDKAQALKYFARASAAPVRPEQVFADTQLEEEAKLALKNSDGEALSRKKDLLSNLNAAADTK
ncbi:MAG: TRAP transporter TatT component family protein [Methylovulum sp.]|nr:TRAP transporter TatT component family protein [Methylovulum sp.]